MSRLRVAPIWQRWIEQLLPLPQARSPHGRRRARKNARLGVEALEDRALPSGFHLADPNPQTNDGFGTQVVPLPNGNVVVTAPNYNADAGAVYLFDGTNGNLISSLFGSNNGDSVGIDTNGGGVTVLANGNFVVDSPNWDNDIGAVTFGSATAGVNGVISSANSLVGSTSNDFVGGYFDNGTLYSGVTALSNGNYVVVSPSWSGNLGAVTFGSGTTGVSGAVSAANSLVGSTSGDEVGGGTSGDDEVPFDGVVALTNGNYVVGSPYWGHNLGAVTFASGTTGLSGPVSAANSLVGSTSGDKVGLELGSDGFVYNGITALTNGNYVVASPDWNLSTGAVTFGSGTTGVTGAVSASNSLVGSSSLDQIGSGGSSNGITALTNGNYVVASPNWNNFTGAVTFGNGATGISGAVSAANSLVGSTGGGNGDGVGNGGVVALTNGNYVVNNYEWSDGTGAVTFGNGTTGVSGVVSAANSLVGSISDDFAQGIVGDSVGIGGITALNNGNYVVNSYGWDHDTGAVTFGSGTTGVSGVISSSNSLVGSTSGNRVGESGQINEDGVTGLSNGNYVVASPSWNGNTGAVTFGNGTTGVSGVVSDSNSLVGAATGDEVGDVTKLSNGNYVVVGLWNGEDAVTFGNGATGTVGVVTSANSLLGAGNVTALSNGNYVVETAYLVTGTGAVTIGNGTTGTVGVVSAANSLVGSTNGDYVGYAQGGQGQLVGNITALSNGDFLVGSPMWNDSTGAVTWGDGTTGVVGAVSAGNSIVGTAAQSGMGSVVLDQETGDVLIPFVQEGTIVVQAPTGPFSSSSPTTLAQYENAGPATITVKNLLGSNFAGFGGAKSGLAVVGTSGAGTWQYFNGSAWTTISGASQAHALLLPDADMIRFMPTANTSGQADLQFSAWNGSVGTAGGFYNIASTGSGTPFSSASSTLAVTVNPVPLWTAASVALPAITNQSTPAGSSVASIFGNDFHDDNSSVSVGVAIVGTTGTSDGAWQYSTDGGTNWTNFWAVSASNALLLSVDDLIRFAPKASFIGNVTATLQVDAWDGTHGTAAASGATKGFDITATGGASGFSTTRLTASCLVNDAPTLAATTGPTLPAAVEGMAKTVAVGTLITDGQISDPNAGAAKGIAIVGIGSDEWPGSWQYSLNGTTWAALPSVSEASAFLLPSTATLRFNSTVQVDSAATTAPATLTYRAWDRTAGTAGTLFGVTATGGATSISSAEITASLPVNFVNHAPTWAGTAPRLPAEPPGTTPVGSSVASIFGANFMDADGNPVGVAIVAMTGTSDGTWQYSTDNGTTWTNFWAVSATNALLLSADDLIRFVPNSHFTGNAAATLQAYAWDGTQGTAAASGAMKGFDIAATGGASAFSTTRLTLTVPN